MPQTESYVNHPLNFSKTKETHLFPRATRFMSEHKKTPGIFYNLPSMKQTRTTSFGYGNKQSIISSSNSPPPGAYSMPTEFGNKNKLANTTSLHIGRQKTHFGSFILQALKHSKNVPSPDKYTLPAPTTSIPGGKIANRVQTEPDMVEQRRRPGPGTYELDATQMGQKKGSYVLSHYRNNQSPRYYGSTISKDQLQTKKKVMSPTLDIHVECKELGKYASSKHRNSVASSFTKAKRPSIQHKANRDRVPGFKYSRFSEFGTLS